MGEQLKNVMVGVFAVAACVLLVSLILFLKPSVGDGKEILYARFTNINNINVGTRVLFAGKAVGEVTAITVVKDAREQKTDALGQVYYYQLTLKVDSSVKVYNIDDVALETSGLLGEKSVSITPRTPPKGVLPKLITDQPIYGNSIDPIQSAFIELSSLANTMEGTFDEITLWIQQYGHSVGTAVESANDAINEVKYAVKQFNNLEIMNDLKSSSANLAATLGDARTSLSELREGNVFGNICGTMEHVEAITNDIAQGRGTVGKLITQSDLYLQVEDILSKGNTLMNDINHYGVLFHLNKQWQRQRLQRAELLTKLSTPESFRAYFETEVDQINTAMERIGMLIDKAEQTPQKGKLLQSERFKRDFADLMHKADQLTENLRTFNEQLVNQEAK